MVKKNLSKQKVIKFTNKLLGISEGLLGKFVDAVLILSILPFESYNIKGASHRVIAKSAEINYQTIKNSFKNAIKLAKTRGWIMGDWKGEKINLEITKAGLKRLESILPHYDEKRKWDRRIYLITYDILEKQRRKRNILRNYLKKLSCAMLQASVWLTPYDPRGVLFRFINENNLENNVIISTVGKDGMIGKENIKLLMQKVYCLDEVNKQYQRYIEEVKSQKFTLFENYFKFLSILKDDPQLPFRLLPNNWLGKKAYKLFKKIESNLKSRGFLMDGRLIKKPYSMRRICIL